MKGRMRRRRRKRRMMMRGECGGGEVRMGRM
jgi:hypothetical protein